jgi:hypothetical protein
MPDTVSNIVYAFQPIKPSSVHTHQCDTLGLLYIELYEITVSINYLLQPIPGKTILIITNTSFATLMESEMKNVTSLHCLSVYILYAYISCISLLFLFTYLLPPTFCYCHQCSCQLVKKFMYNKFYVTLKKVKNYKMFYINV